MSMSETSGAVLSFCFLPPDDAASCTIGKTYKVLNLQDKNSVLSLI